MEAMNVHPKEHHEGDQVSHMQRPSCRIKASVDTNSFSSHQCIKSVSRAIWISLNVGLWSDRLPCYLTNIAPTFENVEHALPFTSSYLSGPCLPLDICFFLFLEVILVNSSVWDAMQGRNKAGLFS